jgi:hypothetical protein
MIEKGRTFVRDLSAKLRYRYLPGWVDYLTVVATRQALKKLAAAGVKRVLVDNTVLAHGVTHETAWVSTGKARWGDHEVETGYAARIPVHDDHDQSAAARSVRYLPGIVSLAKRGHLTLAVSRELQDEQWAQPLGRFSGYGYFDLSLFGGIAFDVIEDPQYSVVFGDSTAFPSVREQRSRRLATKEDPLYRELLSVLGTSNSQDAWHIVTAECNACYCFLTMDFSLIRSVRAQAKNKVIEALKTRVLSPEEFGREFSITPISPRLFSYHRASFPVVHQENWPDSKRRGRSKDPSP